MRRRNQTVRLVKAVLSNNVRVTKRIIESGNYDATVLYDVYEALGLESYSMPPIPLYYISLCNQIYLSADWSKSFQPKVNRNIRGCNQLIAYWAKLGFDVTTPINFDDYWDIVAFYNTTTQDGLLHGTEEQLQALGYDLQEARLCYALASYDWETISRLLDLKVNPDVWIQGEWTPAESAYKEDGANGLSFVEDAVYTDPWAYRFFQYYSIKNLEKLDYPTDLTFHCLFMAAAYLPIYRKMEALGFLD